MDRILITGAAGFIGSNLVRHLLAAMPDTTFVGFDALTYSGSVTTLADVIEDHRFAFVQGDVADRDVVRSLFAEYDPSGVIHLAAESHVDRSILDPLIFVETNVVGTVVLLQEAARSWGGGSRNRFHHVSTDEVFGALGSEGRFDEQSEYKPNSPYAASKAASDHFVRAWGKTFDLEYVITNCSNNYGPYQFPEKLVPLVIDRASRGESVPVYGQGSNIRDWLHVDDHCRALELAYTHGESMQTYSIGGGQEVTNLFLVELVLDTYDDLVGHGARFSRDLITFVEDRPGHDYRYSMDSSFIRETLGWEPTTPLSQGIRSTVAWYLENQDWVASLSSDDHIRFEDEWYGQRKVT